MPTRRQFLVSASGAAVALQAQNRPPNFILFYTDDQSRWSVGSYGNTQSHTPNMDRIGREGAVFDRAFVSTPVCSPARAALYTSQYSFRTKVLDFLDHRREPEHGLSPSFPTWPQILQKAGYTTGLVGKWHLGLRPETHPTRRGFDYFYGFLTGGNTPKDPWLEVDGKDQTVKGFLVDHLGDAAIEFVRKNRAKPFSLSLAFRDPHGPYTPVPPQDDALFRDKKLENPEYKDVDPAWVDKQRRDYYKSVAAADRNMGRVLDELDKLGLTQNTVVIFTSDHGYMIGQHGLNTKGNATWVTRSRFGDRRPNMFDDSIMPPMTMRWPGVIKPGTRIKEMVSHLDFFPTILSIAGATHLQPEGYVPCGRDMTPLLRGQKTPWRNTVFGDYHQIHYYDDVMRMIRTEDWKLITHTSLEYRDELYSLRDDPEETKSLIDHQPLLSKARALRDRLRSWQRWMGDPELRG